MALHITDQEVHVGHRGREGGQVLKVLLVLELLDVKVPAAFQVADGQLPHHPGLGGQLLVPLAPGVVVAQGEEGRPQQKQRQKHHADGDGHLPPVQASELVMDAGGQPPERSFHVCLPILQSVPGRLCAPGAAVPGAKLISAKLTAAPPFRRPQAARRRAQ